MKQNHIKHDVIIVGGGHNGLVAASTDKPECVAAMKQLAAQLHAGSNALNKD